MKPLHVLRPYYNKDQIIDEIRETLVSGWTGDGGKTTELEMDWNTYTDWEYNIYVNSCTAALHLALLALKEREPGKTEVIVPDITFVSTAAVVEQSGLNLILCDVDKDLTISMSDLEKKVNSNTLAVFYVGIGGNTNKLGAISEELQKRNCKLVIDAAHMGGSRMEDGSQLSSVKAEFCCYSYQAVKNLGIADSGMVSFNDKTYHESVKKYRWLGINQTTYERTINNQNSKQYKWEYEIDRIGYKYNGNALIAACCLAILRTLEEDNCHRRQIRSWYEKEIESSDNIYFITHQNEAYTSGHLCQVLALNTKNSGERNHLIEKLNAEKIYPGVHYQPLSMSKFYKSKGKDCVNSKKIGSQIISLPCHMGVDINDVKRVTQALKKYA